MTVHRPTPTRGTVPGHALRLEVPTLEPDDQLVERLAAVAASTRPRAARTSAARTGWRVALATAGVTALVGGGAWGATAVIGRHPGPAPQHQHHHGPVQTTPAGRPSSPGVTPGDSAGAGAIPSSPGGSPAASAATPGLPSDGPTPHGTDHSAAAAGPAAQGHDGQHVSDERRGQGSSEHAEQPGGARGSEGAVAAGTGGDVQGGHGPDAHETHQPAGRGHGHAG